jgi:hypothetical protein
MENSSIKSRYINSDNFTADIVTDNFNSETVSPQIPDAVRYYSKNFWTIKNNKIIDSRELSFAPMFSIEQQGETLILHANKDKFVEEYFENGILETKFSKTAWQKFLTFVLPSGNQIFEDYNIDFAEPTSFPEIKKSAVKNLNYFNREFIYNFFSEKYENLVNSQLFDVKVLPSAFDLLDEERIQDRTSRLNLFLSFGGFIDSNFVDALRLSKTINNQVKKYFDLYVDTYNREDTVSVVREIKSQNKQITITKERNNLTNKTQEAFVPFPFYCYMEFSNDSRDKSKLVHVLNSFNKLEERILDDILIQQNPDTKNFIYDKLQKEERTINSFDLLEIINFGVNRSQAGDEPLEVDRAYSFYRLIEYLKENYKQKKREYVNFMDKKSHNEILFYKIEKKQFNFNTEPIQIFYVIPDEKEITKFFDTQIKYGTDYYYILSAFTLVVGNEYSYQPYEYKELEQLNDLEKGRFKLKINNKNTYKILNFELVRFSGAIYEPPVTKPKIILNNFNNNIRFSLETPSESIAEEHTLIENSDFETFQQILKSQDNLEDQKIKTIKNTNSDRIVEIYKNTIKPINALTFQGKLYKTYTFKNSISFSDRILPNTYYYYAFRELNNHGVPSNISEIFEVILKDEDGFTNLEYKSIDLEPKIEKLKTKEMKRYLLLRPSVLQTTPRISNNISSIDQVVFGPKGDKVWNKNFILRIKSKKTNRILQFDLKAILDKKKQ